MILAKDLDEACEIANYISPEHLELSVENPQEWAKKIRHAGAISWDAIPVKALATIVQVPTTFCRPAARRVSLLLWEHMTSKNAPV